jgi:hypothetical protein
MWAGPGAARNDCVWPWDKCEPIRVESLDSGKFLLVRPTMWCHCWTGVSGPMGETERIVDLDPSMVRALGLNPEQGLWRVRVEPLSSTPTSKTLLPDTAMPR